MSTTPSGDPERADFGSEKARPWPDFLSPEAQLMGRVVKRLRGKRTQRELAAAVDLAHSTWSHIERGDLPFTPARCQHIARALGIPLHQLEAELAEARSAALRQLDAYQRPRTAGPSATPDTNRPNRDTLKSGIDKVATGLQHFFDYYYNVLLRGARDAARAGATDKEET